jgi:hypothetical protein
MSNTSDNNREFSEQEVSAVLKRALDLQKKEHADSGYATRLSADDLKKIAQESGISTDYIEQAIAELEQKTTEKAHGIGEIISGGPSLLTLRKELPLEMPKAEFEEMVSTIHGILKVHGQSSIIGNTFTWQHQDPRSGTTFNITVAAKAKKTVLELQANLAPVKGGLFGGLMGGIGGGLGCGFGFGFGLGALHTFLFPLFWIPGILGLSYLFARTLFRGVAKREKKRLKALMKELTDLILRHKQID